MFNYSVDWLKVTTDNIAMFLQRIWRMFWIQALIKPVKDIHTEFLVTKTEYTYKVRFNGQKIYLERILNDTFAPGTSVIYITNGLPLNVYIYKKSEVKPPVYLYKKWKSTYSYLPGHYAYHLGIVYICSSANTNQNPTSSSSWAGTTLQPTFIRKSSEYSTTPSFIVWVPNTLVYDVNKMKALIEYYILAGKSYIIQGY